MRIAFYPEVQLHTSKRNIYTEKIQEILSEIGKIIPAENLIKNPINLFKTDILYLNWFENIFFNKNSLILSKMECFIKLLFLRICKLFHIKIIVSFHNKVPHSFKKNSEIYEKVFKKFFIKYLNIADAIVVLNHYSIDYLVNEFNCKKNKIYYIPHGNYINLYKDYELIKNNSVINVGYVGRIDKYKHVLELVRSFGKINTNKLHLIIEGAVNDPEYKRKITEAMPVNSFYKFDDIEDDELIKKLKQLDVIILPYDSNEALNSGLVYLAMSYKIVVASTEIGCVKDLPDNLYFKINCKDVNNSNLLEESLLNCLLNILNQSSGIQTMKNQAYDYVSNYHDWMLVKERLHQMLEEIK